MRRVFDRDCQLNFISLSLCNLSLSGSSGRCRTCCRRLILWLCKRQPCHLFLDSRDLELSSLVVASLLELETAMLCATYVPCEHEVAMERIIVCFDFAITFMLLLPRFDELLLSVLRDCSWDLKFI